MLRRNPQADQSAITAGHRQLTAFTKTFHYRFRLTTNCRPKNVRGCKKVSDWSLPLCDQTNTGSILLLCRSEASPRTVANYWATNEKPGKSSTDQFGRPKVFDAAAKTWSRPKSVLTSDNILPTLKKSTTLSPGRLNRP